MDVLVTKSVRGNASFNGIRYTEQDAHYIECEANPYQTDTNLRKHRISWSHSYSVSLKIRALGGVVVMSVPSYYKNYGSEVFYCRKEKYLF